MYYSGAAGSASGSEDASYTLLSTSTHIKPTLFLALVRLNYLLRRQPLKYTYHSGAFTILKVTN